MIYRFEKKSKNGEGISLKLIERLEWVVIDSIFVYHFVDLDLKVEIFFEKEGAVENRDVDFEIGDVGTSAHLYWRMTTILFRACLVFYYFFGDKKIAFKNIFDLHFHLFIIELF